MLLLATLRYIKDEIFVCDCKGKSKVPTVYKTGDRKREEEKNCVLQPKKVNEIVDFKTMHALVLFLRLMKH